jgi:hypothetical protein
MHAKRKHQIRTLPKSNWPVSQFLSEQYSFSLTASFVDGYLFLAMQLRDHPLMRKWAYPVWPPIWTTTRPDNNDKPVGEVGTFQQALMSASNSNFIFLVIQISGSAIWVPAFRRPRLLPLAPYYPKIQCGAVNKRDRRLPLDPEEFLK